MSDTAKITIDDLFALLHDTVVAFGQAVAIASDAPRGQRAHIKELSTATASFLASIVERKARYGEATAVDAFKQIIPGLVPLCCDADVLRAVFGTPAGAEPDGGGAAGPPLH